MLKLFAFLRNSGFKSKFLNLSLTWYTSKIFTIPWEITIYSKNIICNLQMGEVKLISNIKRIFLSGRNFPKVKDNTIINSKLCLFLAFYVGLGTSGGSVLSLLIFCKLLASNPFYFSIFVCNKY